MTHPTRPQPTSAQKAQMLQLIRISTAEEIRKVRSAIIAQAGVDSIEHPQMNRGPGLKLWEEFDLLVQEAQSTMTAEELRRFEAAPLLERQRNAGKPDPDLGMPGVRNVPKPKKEIQL